MFEALHGVEINISKLLGPLPCDLYQTSSVEDRENYSKRQDQTDSFILKGRYTFGNYSKQKNGF